MTQLATQFTWYGKSRRWGIATPNAFHLAVQVLIRYHFTKLASTAPVGKAGR
jgi:hypothetical protein